MIRKITFLGTGTSSGIPLIACKCPVCQSKDKKNKRTRSSILIELTNFKNIIIDTSPDFRRQCLANNVKNINAVLFTHCHADHVFGLDDIRIFNVLQRETIPCYANLINIAELKRIFAYIFIGTNQIGGGIPKLLLKKIKYQEIFNVLGLDIIAFEIKHGILSITGFRFQKIAYITDANAIPQSSYQYLKDLDVLILNALRHRAHPTHFNLEQAIAIAQKINAKKTFFTHIDHELEHKQINKNLPKNIKLAFDGLSLSF